MLALHTSSKLSIIQRPSISINMHLLSTSAYAILLLVVFIGPLIICLPHHTVSGAVSVWGGVNNFLLHTVSASDRTAHLSAMQANGVKVLRIFITGVDAGAKGSSSTGVSALEPHTVGVYDDDVLNKIDVLMSEAVQYDVKLLIALHARYSLGCWGRDAYVSKYNITDVSPKCDTAANQPRVFYVNANAQADFDRAIAHILTHRNPYFSNRQWGEISEAVFGFEPENEAQGHMNNPDWGWACRRAATMKKYISNGILVVTGGGVDFATSVVDEHFSCSNIDVVSIHDYSTSASTFSSNLATARSKALASGKRIIMEELGSIGSDARKASVLSALIDATAGTGVPWLPWEFVKPGTNTGDYEFWVGGATWNAVGCRAKHSLTMSGAFSWPEISSTGGSTDSCGSSSSSSLKGDWVQCSASAECANFCCSNQYSGDGKLKCTPGGNQCLKLSDWQFCSQSFQCDNNCCSSKYSSDGKLKCTPGGC